VWACPWSINLLTLVSIYDCPILCLANHTLHVFQHVWPYFYHLHSMYDWPFLWLYFLVYNYSIIYMRLFLIRNCPTVSMCLHLIQCQILKNYVVEFQSHFVHKIINVTVCMFFHYHWIHLSIIRTHLYLYLEFSNSICHAGESQTQKPSLT